eukprot:IDg9686t1
MNSRPEEVSETEGKISDEEEDDFNLTPVSDENVALTTNE